MKRAAVVVLAVVAAVFAVDRVSHALGAANAKTSAASYVAPSPMVAKLPADAGSINATCSANTSACVYVGAGVCARLDCKGAQCDYRAVAIEPDAGWPTFPDAGFALPGDVTLPADTPEGLCLPYSLDSVCAFCEGAGTVQAAPRYPGNGN